MSKKYFSLRKIFFNTFEDHKGRPGEVGGSVPRDLNTAPRKIDLVKDADVLGLFSVMGDGKIIVSEKAFEHDEMVGKFGYKIQEDENGDYVKGIDYAMRGRLYKYKPTGETIAVIYEGDLGERDTVETFLKKQSRIERDFGYSGEPFLVYSSNTGGFSAERVSHKEAY